MGDVVSFPTKHAPIDQRKGAFFDHANWRVSRKGNAYIRTPDATVTLFEAWGGFRYAIARSAALGPTYSTAIYETEAEARRASWAALAGMMERRA